MKSSHFSAFAVSSLAKKLQCLKDVLQHIAIPHPEPTGNILNVYRSRSHVAYLERRTNYVHNKHKAESKAEEENMHLYLCLLLQQEKMCLSLPSSPSFPLLFLLSLS